MNGISKQPILSICIPTWNRATFLKQSLEKFAEQIEQVDFVELELYVSDNCSDDNTPEVVNAFIEQGLPITYNRNEQNIGAARNFVKCMQWASGKYILLLGDDDVLVPGALKYLLGLIRNNDYGLIHLNQNYNYKEKEDTIVYNDLEAFYKSISIWFTFMSGCVFRKEVVSKIDPQKYIETHLLQMPYYLLSAAEKEKNLIVNKQILQIGLDAKSNGGYNFYEVFVKHYLDIWYELVLNDIISIECYEFIKKDNYKRVILPWNYRLLVKKENVKDESLDYIGNRKGFKVKGAKSILKKYYGKYMYYRLSWAHYIKYYLTSL